MRPDPVQDPMLVLCPIGQEGHVNGELLRDRGLPVRVIDGFAIPGGSAETGGLLVAEEAFDGSIRSRSSPGLRRSRPGPTIRSSYCAIGRAASPVR